MHSRGERSVQLSFTSRLGHLVVVLLLLAAAALQVNDPDSWLWMSIYVLAALGPALEIVGRGGLAASLVGIGACLVGAALSAPGFFEYIVEHRGEPFMQQMSADRMYIEEAREFVGAVIAMGLVVLSYWWARRARAG